MLSFLSLLLQKQTTSESMSERSKQVEVGEWAVKAERVYRLVFPGGGGASNGQVAMSALGSGRTCLTAVIAYCPSLPQSSAGSIHQFLLMFVPPSRPGWSYWHCGLYWVMRAYRSGVTPYPCLPMLAPLGRHRFGLVRGLRLINPVGTGCVISWSSPHNYIQHSRGAALGPFCDA